VVAGNIGDSKCRGKVAGLSSSVEGAWPLGELAGRNCGLWSKNSQSTTQVPGCRNLQLLPLLHNAQSPTVTKLSTSWVLDYQIVCHGHIGGSKIGCLLPVSAATTAQLRHGAADATKFLL